MINGILIGIVISGCALVVYLMVWAFLATPSLRARVSHDWEVLRLRVKFKRTAANCQVCQGTGESAFQGMPTGPPPEDGEDLQYYASPLVLTCSRCKGTGESYIYTYRFKCFNPHDFEEFERDDDRVDTYLGGKSEPIQRK